MYSLTTIWGKHPIGSTISMDYSKPCQQLKDDSTVNLLQPQRQSCMLGPHLPSDFDSNQAAFVSAAMSEGDGQMF